MHTIANFTRLFSFQVKYQRVVAGWSCVLSVKSLRRLLLRRCSCMPRMREHNQSTALTQTCASKLPAFYHNWTGFHELAVKETRGLLLCSNLAHLHRPHSHTKRLSQNFYHISLACASFVRPNTRAHSHRVSFILFRISAFFISSTKYQRLQTIVHKCGDTVDRLCCLRALMTIALVFSCSIAYGFGAIELRCMDLSSG